MASKKEQKAKKTAERKKGKDSKPTRRPKQKGKIKKQDQQRPEFSFQMRTATYAEKRENNEVQQMTERGTDPKVAAQVARWRRNRKLA